MQNKAYALAGALCALIVTLSHTAVAATYPVIPQLLVGIGDASNNATVAPPGANIMPCTSSLDPYPVVLVNGTFTVMEDDFGALAPDLANAGYCVYTFNYGDPKSTDLIQSIGPVPASAQQLAAFVNAVRAVTGSAKVDLVGHSQGGMLIEYYAKLVGGAPNIHSVVAISPTTHGTNLDGLVLLAKVFGLNPLVQDFCPACTDQETGSAVITALNNGPIAQHGVTYTVIETLAEFIVTPVGSSFIQEPGVTNEYVQGSCPFDLVGHQDLTYDNTVIQLVKNALTPAKKRSPNCFIAWPAPAQ